MCSAVGSISAQSLSWVSARCQSPVTQSIWKRKTRSFGSAGALRTWSWRAASAPARSPACNNSCAFMVLSFGGGTPGCGARGMARGAARRRARIWCGRPARKPGGRMGFRPSLRHVGTDVPLELGLGALAAFIGLLDVIHLDLGEIEGDVLGQPVLAARTAGGDGGDEHLVHLDGQIFQRVLARLAADDLRLREVIAVGAIEHQHRRGFVDPLGAADVLEVGLAGTAAAAAVKRAALAHAPAPGQQIDAALAFVLVVLGFPGNLALDDEEHVYSHDSISLSAGGLGSGNTWHEREGSSGPTPARRVRTSPKAVWRPGGATL